MLRDFAADGVVYCELRTTPKSRPECGLTKRSYIEAVLAGIAAFKQGIHESPASESVSSAARVPAENVPVQAAAGAAAWVGEVAAGAVNAGSCSTAAAGGMIVDLVLSVDRRESGEQAAETVALAAEFAGRGVVGIDLSGNPIVGALRSL